MKTVAAVVYPLVYLGRTEFVPLDQVGVDMDGFNGARSRKMYLH